VILGQRIQTLMNVRFFDWRDLPILHRYRHRGLFLDAATMLTRGQFLVPAGAMLAYFAPAIGIFTFLCENGDHSESPLLGQVTHPPGSPSARLSFLAPESALESFELPALLDYAALQIGERGAFHIQAEVDEQHGALEPLRNAGFAIYARQRIWQLEEPPSLEVEPLACRLCKDQDVPAVRSLYNDLVPGLVQQVEPPPRSGSRSLVYYQDGMLLAYLELRYGPFGIWVQPFVHPDAENSVNQLVLRLQNLPNRHSRPVYVCVRSYQSWLEPFIDEIGAKSSSSQALMVRHLAISRLAAQVFALPAINGKHPEPTAPMMRLENYYNEHDRKKNY